jgi:hypothetical protein
MSFRFIEVSLLVDVASGCGVQLGTPSLAASIERSAEGHERQLHCLFVRVVVIQIAPDVSIGSSTMLFLEWLLSFQPVESGSGHTVGIDGQAKSMHGDAPGRATTTKAHSPTELLAVQDTLWL